MVHSTKVRKEDMSGSFGFVEPQARGHRLFNKDRLLGTDTALQQLLVV
jgi:hypothetical protein